MLTRIVPDHPPLTQSYPVKLTGEKRQLASALSSRTLIVRRCRQFSGKTPHNRKTPRRTSTKRSPNHVLIVGKPIPFGNAVMIRGGLRCQNTAFARQIYPILTNLESVSVTLHHVANIEVRKQQ
jgi:hypothetical protein